MSLTEEGQALLRRVEQAVNEALMTDIADIADVCIQRRVQINAYDAYAPRHYFRRTTAGGLQDAGQYVHTVDTAAHELTIADDRPEVGYVESGGGWNWAMVPIPPRAYFQDAENDVVNDPETTAAIQSRLDRI